VFRLSSSLLPAGEGAELKRVGTEIGKMAAPGKLELADIPPTASTPSNGKHDMKGEIRYQP
jgi:hypothetical protein